MELSDFTDFCSMMGDFVIYVIVPMQTIFSTTQLGHSSPYFINDSL